MEEGWFCFACSFHPGYLHKILQCRDKVLALLTSVFETTKQFLHPHHLHELIVIWISNWECCQIICSALI
jgi:hypothetical protein